MANPFDAAARLAEAQPVVEDVEQYVAACRRLGYQHRDLTAHPMQVRDWYGGEEGLDLHALDADHAALAAAASVAEDVARMQTDLVAQLDAAWSGLGAAAAHDFLWRTCRSATATSSAVRRAADAVAALRDALWQAVDGKAAATEAVDHGLQQHRSQWLAAATTVTTGAGDVAAASELIDQQVRPFVDLNVGSDWVGAMRSARTSIDAAYDAAIAAATAPAAVFGVPGVLGPRSVPSSRGEAPDRGPTTAAPSSTVPAAAVAPAPAPTATAPAAAVPPGSWSSPAAPWPGAEAAMVPPPAAPLGGSTGGAPMPSMGDLGGGGGSGFGQQLADLIGGLFGSGEGLPDPADMDLEAPDVEEPDEEPDEHADEPEETDGPAAEDVAATVDEPPPPEAPPPPVEEPAPTPVPVPPPPPPAEGLPDAVGEALREDSEPTPCEIAADELPQVGE